MLRAPQLQAGAGVDRQNFEQAFNMVENAAQARAEGGTLPGPPIHFIEGSTRTLSPCQPV